MVIKSLEFLSWFLFSRNKKRNRFRKISWFNPPWSEKVKTKIGQKFLAIIRKNFPKNHPLNKILNTNTIKISYKCMPNLKSHISKHNKKILNERSKSSNEPVCNCKPRYKSECPIPGKCATESVVYRATVRRHDNLAVDTYTGLTSGTFKQRFSKHKSDVNTDKKTATKLSYHLCSLKEKNIQYDVNWDIVARAPIFNPSTRLCRLRIGIGTVYFCVQLVT